MNCGVEEYILNIEPYSFSNGSGKGNLIFYNAHNYNSYKLSAEDYDQDIIPFFRIWIETTSATPFMDLLGRSAFRIWSPAKVIDKTNLLK